MDADPQGHQLYLDTLKAGPLNKAVEVAKIFANANNKNAKELQAKAVGVYVAAGKMDLALEAVRVLHEVCPGYEKTHSAKARFVSKWLQMDEGARKEAFGKNDEKLAQALATVNKVCGWKSK